MAGSWLMQIIDAPGPKDSYTLFQVQGREELSAPFSFTLDILSRLALPDAAAFIGKSFTFAIGDDDLTRQINGLIVDFAILDNLDWEYTKFRLRIAPATWRAEQQTNFRIFEAKTAKQIIAQVLGNYSDISFDDSKVTKSQVTREYCVQYRETDWNFITRLAEDEGVFYLYQQAVDAGHYKHKLVFSDSDQIYQDAADNALSRYGSSGTSLSLDELAVTYCGLPSQVTLGDYAYKNAGQTAVAVSSATPAWADSAVKRFDFPGGFATSGDGTRYADVTIHREEVAGLQISGSSTLHILVPGERYQVSGLPSGMAAGTLVITAVGHSLIQPADSQLPATYTNQFTAIPHDVVFAPPRRAARAIAPGPQIAVVTDQGDDTNGGRVRVKFYWQTFGSDASDTQSCWARVVQGWVGPSYGEHFTPRVNMEVLVVFLEGNPDFPVIVGCLANSTNTPPYNKENITQSGWKTQSMGTDGSAGTGFNELRFEDKSDSEEIYIHAAKDMKTDVLNDQTLTVNRNQTETIDKDQTISVKGKQTETIDKDQSVTINQNRTVSIPSGDDALSVGKTIKVEANTSIELKVGGSSILIEPAKITLKSVQIEITADADLKAQGLNVGITGNAKVETKAPIVQVSGDGTVIIKGGIVMIN